MQSFVTETDCFIPFLYCLINIRHTLIPSPTHQPKISLYKNRQIRFAYCNLRKRSIKVFKDNRSGKIIFICFQVASYKQSARLKLLRLMLKYTDSTCLNCLDNKTIFQEYKIIPHAFENIHVQSLDHAHILHIKCCCIRYCLIF